MYTLLWETSTSHSCGVVQRRQPNSPLLFMWMYMPWGKANLLHCRQGLAEDGSFAKGVADTQRPLWYPTWKTLVYTLRHQFILVKWATATWIYIINNTTAINFSNSGEYTWACCLRSIQLCHIGLQVGIACMTFFAPGQTVWAKLISPLHKLPPLSIARYNSTFA